MTKPHPSRRCLNASLLVLGSTALLGAAPPRARVIVDNDLAGDPDGLLALAYQLVSPAAETVLVTTTALDPVLVRLVGNLQIGGTAKRGAELGRDCVARTDRVPSPSVIAGSETFGAGEAQVSAAAHAIVDEALRDDKRKLYLTCGGPLTNVCAALKVAPSIASRLVLIWIGGGESPIAESEYNFRTDPAAARHVLFETTVPVWRIPEAAYSRLTMSYAAIKSDLRPISPLTAWLSERLLDVPAFARHTLFKGIGDAAMVSLIASDGAVSAYSEQLIGPRLSRLYSPSIGNIKATSMLEAFRKSAFGRAA